MTDIWLVSHSYLVDWGPGRSEYPKKYGLVLANNRKDAIKVYKQTFPSRDMSYNYDAKQVELAEGEVFTIDGHKRL